MFFAILVINAMLCAAMVIVLSARLNALIITVEPKDEMAARE